MTRRNRLWSVAASTVAALATASLLSACGAGQISSTAVTVPAIQGTDATAMVSSDDPNWNGATLGVRNATIVYNGPTGYPAGSAAPLALYLFNDTPAPMTLVSVQATITVPAMGSGAPAASAAVVLTGSPSASPSAVPSAPASALPGGSASVTPAPVVTTPPAVGTPTFQVVVPQSPAEITALTPAHGIYLQLVQFGEALTPGSVVHLIFTFTLGDGSTKVLGDDPKQPVDLAFGPPVTPAPRAPLSLSPVEN